MCDNRSSIGGGDRRLYQSANGNWHGNCMPPNKPDDVVVADSAYGTYTDLALFAFSQRRCPTGNRQSPTAGEPNSGLDSPCFVNIMRASSDFRRGQKLGIGDHKVLWQRPTLRPQSMNSQDNESVTASIEVRSGACIDSTTGVSTQGNHFGHHRALNPFAIPKPNSPTSINCVGKQLR